MATKRLIGQSYITDLHTSHFGSYLQDLPSPILGLCLRNERLHLLSTCMGVSLYSNIPSVRGLQTSTKCTSAHSGRRSADFHYRPSKIKDILKYAFRNAPARVFRVRNFKVCLIRGYRKSLMGHHSGFPHLIEPWTMPRRDFICSDRPPVVAIEKASRAETHCNATYYFRFIPPVVLYILLAKSSVYTNVSVLYSLPYCRFPRNPSLRLALSSVFITL